MYTKYKKFIILFPYAQLSSNRRAFIWGILYNHVCKTLFLNLKLNEYSYTKALATFQVQQKELQKNKFQQHISPGLEETYIMLEIYNPHCGASFPF